MNHHDAKNQKSGRGSKRGLVPLDDILGGLFSGEMLPQKHDETPPGDTKKNGSASKGNAKIEKAAAQIAEHPDQTEAAYLARELVQCTLPHKNPKDVTSWVRRNGDFALILETSLDQKTLKPVGLPYGSMPRLILLWIVTEAIRTKSRHIKLGGTLNDFLRALGLDPNTGGGKFSDAKRLKQQVERLLHCRISFHYSEGNAQKGRKAFLNMELAREGSFWWDIKNPEQGGLFESEIVLGEVFFEAITAAPVPVDMRALLPLKKSPLAIDVYTWSTYRLHTMQRAGHRQIKIPLADLQKQFGSEYNRLRDFKAAFTEALDKVQTVFPALDYRFEEAALVLQDSRQRPAIAPKDKTAAQRRLAEQRPFDQVSEKARARFKTDFPRWDVDAVISDFYLWRQEKGEVSGSTDAHFRAFSKTWIERNR